jgi:hypothetical protein
MMDRVSRRSFLRDTGAAMGAANGRFAAHGGREGALRDAADLSERPS